MRVTMQVALGKMLFQSLKARLVETSEIGYLSYDDHAADLLYKVINPRYEKRRSPDTLCSYHSLAHPFGGRLGNIEFDESAGVEEKDQRRSSLTISEASLQPAGRLATRRSVHRFRRAANSSRASL